LASIVATALGATIIEKHFTLSRDGGGVDSSFSLEPHEMKSLVNDTKSAHSALGIDDMIRSEVERSNKVFRRSLYFVKAINRGELITENHVRRIRPGFGLEPKYFRDVIGKRATRDIKKGDRVTKDDFQ
jgi:N-acetylneuraminate synthase